MPSPSPSPSPSPGSTTKLLVSARREFSLTETEAKAKWFKTCIITASHIDTILLRELTPLQIHELFTRPIDADGNNLLILAAKYNREDILKQFIDVIERLEPEKIIDVYQFTNTKSSSRFLLALARYSNGDLISYYRKSIEKAGIEHDSIISLLRYGNSTGNAITYALVNDMSDNTPELSSSKKAITSLIDWFNEFSDETCVDLCSLTPHKKVNVNDQIIKLIANDKYFLSVHMKRPVLEKVREKFYSYAYPFRLQCNVDDFRLDRLFYKNNLAQKLKDFCLILNTESSGYGRGRIYRDFDKVRANIMHPQYVYDFVSYLKWSDKNLLAAGLSKQAVVDLKVSVFNAYYKYLQEIDRRSWKAAKENQKGTHLLEWFHHHILEPYAIERDVELRGHYSLPMRYSPGAYASTLAALNRSGRGTRFRPGIFGKIAKAAIGAAVLGHVLSAGSSS